MATGSTPPCSATTKAGTPCGKTTGTQPTKDGARCYTHLAKEARLKDPGARCPVKRPRSPEDLQRIMDWALVRASEGRMGSPQVNALSGMAKTWLIVYRNKLRPIFTTFQDIHEDMLALLEVSRARAGCEPKYQEALRRIHVNVKRVSTLMGGGKPDDDEPPQEQQNANLDTDADPEEGDYDVF